MPNINLHSVGNNIDGTLYLNGNLLFADTMLKSSATKIEFRDETDSSYASVAVATATLHSNLEFDTTGSHIRPKYVADSTLLIYAFDTGVGNAEVARLQSSANPYFQVGRDDTGVATDSVTDMLVIQGGAGSSNEAAGFGAGIAVKLGNAASEVEERASIDFTLVTATDGSEDANMVFSLMDGGVAPAATLTLAGADKSATFAGNMNIGGNKIVTTNTMIKDGGDASIHLREDDDSDYADLAVKSVAVNGNIECNSDGGHMRTKYAQDTSFLFYAFDTGVGNLEVARLQSAATPYFQVTEALMIKERAADIDDVGGLGQLWVKNETPCELWFTDDAGTATKIV